MHQNGAEPNTFDKICDIVEKYVDGRKEGHSAEYMLSVLKISEPNQKTDDNDLKIILKQYPETSLKKLQKDWEIIDSNSGIKIRSVGYYLVDGDIAWTYQFSIDPNNANSHVFREKVDAKEYDPKYKKIIKEAEIAAASKMEEKKVSGLGSIHLFWIWKKEYLQQKGVDWKSPVDLNPGTSYD